MQKLKLNCNKHSDHSQCCESCHRMDAFYIGFVKLDGQEVEINNCCTSRETVIKYYHENRESLQTRK